MIFFLPGAEVWWKARKRPGLPRKRVFAALPLPQTLHFADGPSGKQFGEKFNFKCISTYHRQFRWKIC